jgi:Domain of unknown function (DUF4340)
VEAAVSVRLPRRLLAVWLALLALVVLIALVEYEETQPQAVDENLLLPVPVSELAALELGVAGALHRFERDAAGAWFYHGSHAASQAAHAHQPDPAAAQRIGAAFDALGRARIERRLPYDRDSRQYGIAAPQMVLLVYRRADGPPIAQYAIGDVAPDTFSRYVHRIGSAEVVTIPNYQAENLLSLLADQSSRPLMPLR